MAHLRLFLVFAAFAALGYAAYRQGWLPIQFNTAAPSPEPTLGFTVNQGRHGRHSHGRNLGRELASRWGKHGSRTQSAPALSGTGPAASATQLAALRKPGSNALEIPGFATA